MVLPLDARDAHEHVCLIAAGFLLRVLAGALAIAVPPSPWLLACTGLLALLLGFVNAIIRPLLVLITLPITILTLGLFTLVINGLMFWMVSGLVEGFVVPGFWAAFWGALVYSLLTWMVSLALSDKDD